MSGLSFEPQVAYFSMEIAFSLHARTYSGGLGVLAGDMMRSAADLRVPLIGVTLASRAGYILQSISRGQQRESRDPWDPSSGGAELPTQVKVRIGRRDVAIRGWLHHVRSEVQEGGSVPVLLLDTDIPGNSPSDRKLTDHLYGGDHRYRLKQEMVLGVGGVRMLQAMGIHVRKYHLNEGHAALLTLELHRQFRASLDPEAARQRVRDLCVFTTHTPVAAGHDHFPYLWAAGLVSELADPVTLRSFAGSEDLNMTRLALSLSGWVNGVAEKHAETSRVMFPGETVHAITNGVHPWTWTSDPLRRLFDAHMPGWALDPARLSEAARLPADAVWAAHQEAKASLIAGVNGAAGGAALQADRLTLGFARRMTGYKRPLLLFSDVERLRALARTVPLQVVLAGKAHPRDNEGKAAIRSLHELAAALAPEIPMAFVPGHDMNTARLLVGGCDIWVNTPIPPLEASGTSGMKAAFNGVPSLSVLDGWWLEGHAEGETGWAIGDEHSAVDNESAANSLYEKLEQAVAPRFASAESWASLMKSTIAGNGSVFHSHRMVRRYVTEAYQLTP